MQTATLRRETAERTTLISRLAKMLLYVINFISYFDWSERNFYNKNYNTSIIERNFNIVLFIITLQILSMSFKKLQTLIWFDGTFAVSSSLLRHVTKYWPIIMWDFQPVLVISAVKRYTKHTRASVFQQHLHLPCNYYCNYYNCYYSAMIAPQALDRDLDPADLAGSTQYFG